MSLLLNIDTTCETAFASIVENGVVVAIRRNENMRDHASFLHPAIEHLFTEINKKISAIDAVAVNSGPGSYTGIRVGMAAAKGYCFTLQKPLILLNGLELLAAAAIAQKNLLIADSSTLVCPMIDARRMEVFTAVYTPALQCLLQPQPLILNLGSFSHYYPRHQLVYTGNGVAKWQHICTESNAIFMNDVSVSASMAKLSSVFYQQQRFEDVTLSDAFYAKEFQSGHNPA